MIKFENGGVINMSLSSLPLVPGHDGDLGGGLDPVHTCLLE